MKITKKKRGITVLLVTLVLLAIYIVIGFYNKLGSTYYTYRDKELPAEFDGYRIAFISDFHCKEVGRDEIGLIKRIDDFHPDIVVFTGDMIDGSHKSLEPVEELLAGLKGKYPMYAVNGNHETDIMDNFIQLKGLYTDYGVIYMEDATDILTRDGMSIGINGKSFKSYWTVDMLKGPDRSKAKFHILLYHDATAFPILRSLGYNLILAGHTHGGIIRLPFIGGLISTRKTLFAKYDSGMYHSFGSTMISSRGIGDASIPRFYNNSELVCITLKTKE